MRITLNPSAPKFTGIFSSRQKAEKINKLYSDIENKTYEEYDTFITAEENIRENYENEQKAIKENYIFPKKRLIKLNLYYSGQQDALREAREAFIKQHTIRIDDLKKTIEALKIAGEAVDYINKLENNYAALVQVRNRALAQQNNDKGFNRLAGYEEEKNFIQKVFLNPVNMERSKNNAEIPKGILFFGPTGCGKTRTVRAIAEDLYPDDTERAKYFKDIKTYEDPDKVLKRIEATMEEANENFKGTNCRTIILLDEIDALASKDTELRIIDGLKALISSAEDNYCTFFMTTNYPNEVHPDITAANRSEYIISMDPPYRDNLKSVCKYYFDKLNIKNLNYDKLAEIMTEENDRGYYSNSGIENIYEKARNYPQLNENDLIKIIKATPPNITYEEYAEYLEDRQKFLHGEAKYD